MGSGSFLVCNLLGDLKLTVDYLTTTICLKKRVRLSKSLESLLSKPRSKTPREFRLVKRYRKKNKRAREALKREEEREKKESEKEEDKGSSGGGRGGWMPSQTIFLAIGAIGLTAYGLWTNYRDRIPDLHFPSQPKVTESPPVASKAKETDLKDDVL